MSWWLLLFGAAGLIVGLGLGMTYAYVTGQDRWKEGFQSGVAFARRSGRSS